MGFVKRNGDDKESDDESADFVMTSLKKNSPTKSLKVDAKPSPDAPAKKTTPKMVVKVKAKNVSVKTAADKLKAKAKMSGKLVKKGLNKKVKKVADGDNVVKRQIAFKPKKLSPALAAICGKRLLSRQVCRRSTISVVDLQGICTGE